MTTTPASSCCRRTHPLAATRLPCSGSVTRSSTFRRHPTAGMRCRCAALRANLPPPTESRSTTRQLAVTVAAGSTDGGWPVRIDDASGCDRFVAQIVRGIDPSRSAPDWIRRRLQTAGIRSVSLAVDVTNYVMLELGQPLHAYDLAKLRGPIVVRRALPGERVRTLDDVDRATHPDDLLITDDSGAIGIAGVMGGATTEIDATTSQVLIEGAHFTASGHFAKRASAWLAQRSVASLRTRRRSRGRTRRGPTCRGSPRRVRWWHRRSHVDGRRPAAARRRRSGSPPPCPPRSSESTTTSTRFSAHCLRSAARSSRPARSWR